MYPWWKSYCHKGAALGLPSPLTSLLFLPPRKRKILLYKKAAEATLSAETGVKQVFMPVMEQSDLNPLTQDLLPKQQKPGDVLVQWRDGTVTALYADNSEDV